MADGALRAQALGQAADLAIAALTTAEAFMALGNERLQGDGATFIRNPQAPDIWDANHVANATASTPEEVESLLRQVEAKFASFRHRCFHLDFRTPPGLEARLLLDGYENSDSLILVLESGLTGDRPNRDIRPVESEADWAEYSALHDIDWREYKQRMPGVGNYDEGTARQMMLVRRSQCPPARMWLAWMDGEPRAYLTSWSGVDGMGMLEDLFCHPEYRRRGLATALIHHGVAAARADGASAVMITADPKDTPKNMYAALGFRPVAQERSYLKQIDSKG